MSVRICFWVPEHGCHKVQVEVRRQSQALVPIFHLFVRQGRASGSSYPHIYLTIVCWGYRYILPHLPSQRLWGFELDPYTFTASYFLSTQMFTCGGVGWVCMRGGVRNMAKVASSYGYYENCRRWCMHGRHRYNLHMCHQYLYLLLAPLREEPGSSFTRTAVLHAAILTNCRKVIRVKRGITCRVQRHCFRSAPSLRPCSFPNLRVMVRRKEHASLGLFLPDCGIRFRLQDSTFSDKFHENLWNPSPETGGNISWLVSSVL